MRRRETHKTRLLPSLIVVFHSRKLQKKKLHRLLYLWHTKPPNEHPLVQYYPPIYCFDLSIYSTTITKTFYRIFIDLLLTFLILFHYISLDVIKLYIAVAQSSRTIYNMYSVDTYTYSYVSMKQSPFNIAHYMLLPSIHPSILFIHSVSQVGHSMSNVNSVGSPFFFLQFITSELNFLGDVHMRTGGGWFSAL